MGVLKRLHLRGQTHLCPWHAPPRPGPAHVWEESGPGAGLTSTSVQGRQGCDAVSNSHDKSLRGGERFSSHHVSLVVLNFQDPKARDRLSVIRDAIVGSSAPVGALILIVVAEGMVLTGLLTFKPYFNLLDIQLRVFRSLCVVRNV